MEEFAAPSIKFKVSRK